jgi:CBS domain-containing protein
MGELSNMPVADVMTYRPAVIAPEEPLSRAAELFEAGGLDLLPVCREGWLVGVLSRQDILRACAAALTVGGLEGPALGGALCRPVEHFMSAPLATVESQAPLGHVLEQMVGHGYHALPVVFGALLLGIVTRRELLRAVRRAAGTNAQVAA